MDDILCVQITTAEENAGLRNHVLRAHVPRVCTRSDFTLRLIMNEARIQVRRVCALFMRRSITSCCLR